ncbi:MAG: hypothetical protein KA715_05160 [Xanthomonadaceae bacterium]|nr:hypothetical protein [Xanthomonadaceae bacterium]
MNSASLAAEGALSVALATLLFLSRGGRKSILLGLVLGWSLTCFAYWLYPAFQVPVAWVGLAIFTGLFWRHKQSGLVIFWDINKTVGLALAILIPLISLCLFYIDAKDAISAMANTVYPGQRVSYGGQFAFWPLFSNNLIPFGIIRQYKNFSNICESASSILIYPVLFVFIFKQLINKKVDPVVMMLGIVLVILTAWTWIPLPHWVGRISGFSRVPESRAVIGHAFANVALLVTISSLYFKNDRTSLEQKKIAFLWGISWTTLVMLFFPQALTDAPGESVQKMTQWILYAVGANFCLAYLIGLKHRTVISYLAFFHFILTIPFNPIVKGGASDLFENSLFAKTLFSLDNEAKKNKKWIVFGNASLATFTRTLGLTTINGVHVYPQNDIWKKLDPKVESRNITNRYAHVQFSLAKSNETMTIKSPQPDVIDVKISPLDPKFLSLGATFILTQEKLPNMAHSHWDLAKHFESYWIYKRIKL